MFESATDTDPVLNANQGVLCVLDVTGDTKLVWDRNDTDDVQNARETFDRLKQKGYLAYSVKKDGEKGEVLRAFDPDAEKIIMSKPLVGG